MISVERIIIFSQLKSMPSSRPSNLLAILIGSSDPLPCFSKDEALPECRALTHLFGNGAGAFRIGKNSVVLTKIGKIYKVLCIEEFIVRLI